MVSPYPVFPMLVRFRSSRDSKQSARLVNKAESSGGCFMQDNKAPVTASRRPPCPPLEILTSLLAASATLPTRACPIVGQPQRLARPRAYWPRRCVLCRLRRVGRIRTVDAPRGAAFATRQQLATGQRDEWHGMLASWSAAAARRRSSLRSHSHAARACA